MEHILQFAISIDDDRIKKQIETSAETAVVRELKSDIKSTLINKWGVLTDVGEAIIKDTIDEYKDEIIKLAVENVVESIKRSKRYRDALADIVEEIK